VIAPVAKSRLSSQVPFGLQMGEPEDVAPLVTFLLGDAARHITGQTYTVNGGRIGVYNQPIEVRSMYKIGRWSPEEIAEHIDQGVGQEPLPILARVKMMAEAAARKDKPNH